MGRALLLSALLLGGLLAAGCGDESDPAGPDSGGGESGGPGPFADPDAVIQALAQAWEQRDHALMQNVLAPDFKFFIRDDEAVDFPWLAQPWWDRAQELSFAFNMFDPGFTGANPPVQSIEFEYLVLSSNQPQPGTDEVTIDAIITVLTGPADGWASDTRFILQVQKQPDGFLLLSEMKEVLKLEPARGALSSVESSTWGQIKGLYR